MDGFVIVEEQPVSKSVEEKDFDWEKNKDLKKFLGYLQGKIGKVPSHSGKTTAGCERAITYLKTLDKEISKAIGEDMGCDIDDQAVEKLRKDIRKMIKTLNKRHTEINEAYDADDDKFASEIILLKKEAAEASVWVCPECKVEVKPGDEEHETRHKVKEHGQAADDMAKDAGVGELKCKKCGVKVKDQRAGKVHAETAHKGESVSFTDYKKEGSAHACACEVKQVVAAADDSCPKCKIKLWATNENFLECIACDEVFEKKIVKEAGTPRIQLVMSPFERSICGIIVNAVVANGKNVETVYAELKKKYAFTDRDELGITQLLIDLGYPVARNFMGMPHSNNIEFATNYQA